MKSYVSELGLSVGLGVLFCLLCSLVIDVTPNFLFANGVDGPTKIGTKSLSHWEGSTDPRLWHMLIDRPDGSVEPKLPPARTPGALSAWFARGAAVEVEGVAELARVPGAVAKP